ncbi:MAG: serine protease, partial [Oscillospiraceae bacterium]
MERLSFRLSDFEGPLELLLYLISKHKLDILDIEISELLRQY